MYGVRWGCVLGSEGFATNGFKVATILGTAIREMAAREGKGKLTPVVSLMQKSRLMLIDDVLDVVLP